MSRRAKLIVAVRRNPKDVRFDDACRIAGWLGFRFEGQSGSNHAFARPGEPTLLNFQNRGGRIPAYQARPLLAMIDRYVEDEP